MSYLVSILAGCMTALLLLILIVRFPLRLIAVVAGFTGGYEAAQTNHPNERHKPAWVAERLLTPGLATFFYQLTS